MRDMHVPVRGGRPDRRFGVLPSRVPRRLFARLGAAEKLLSTVRRTNGTAGTGYRGGGYRDGGDYDNDDQRSRQRLMTPIRCHSLTNSRVPNLSTGAPRRLTAPMHAARSYTDKSNNNTF